MITISSMSNGNRVGIKMPWGSEPTADFHTVGTVRHESLPTGSGTIVVVDAAGNLYRSNSSAYRTTAVDTPAKQEIDLLKKEVAELQDLLKVVQSQVAMIGGKGSVTTRATTSATRIVLYQNTPNPTAGITNIKYSFDQTRSAGRAFLNIYNLEGKQLKRIAISTAQTGSVDVYCKDLTPGFYTAIIFSEEGESSNSIKLVVAN